MAEIQITGMTAASTLVGSELIEVSQHSTTVTYTAITIGALAVDNTFTDSAAQFIVEGFAVGDRIGATGFSNGANNLLVGTVTALDADTMTIGGTDGDVIVDETEGASVTIFKWETHRQQIGTVIDRNIDTDTTLAADSDARVASQKAVKAYVDGKVTGLLEDKGAIDCSANPNYPAALKGDAYRVSVAGKIGGGSGLNVDVGDLIVASADNAGGTQAAVGSSWYILEHNILAASLTVKYRLAFSIENSAPTAAEVMLRHVLQHDVTFPDNFAGSVGRKPPSGSNPASTQTFDILHNGSSIGSVAISTGGVFTWNTTGGALVAVAGDEIRVEAPAAPDAALEGMSFTIYGEEA